jgi:hypothetical protein
MYVVKNKEGHLMRVAMFPATPPYVAMFHEKIDLELAEKYATKEEALEDIICLLVYNDEPISKFDGYTIEEI